MNPVCFNFVTSAKVIHSVVSFKLDERGND